MMQNYGACPKPGPKASVTPSVSRSLEFNRVLVCVAVQSENHKQLEYYLTPLS